MTRLMVMTFFGEERWRELTPRRIDPADLEDPPEHYHPHESASSMTVPMILLAIGSVGAGAFLVLHERLATFLEPSLGPFVEPDTLPAPFPLDLVPVIAVVLMVLGAGLAWLLVGRRPVPVARPQRVSWPVRAARADLFANAINETLIARPGIWLSRALVYLDNRGVDGAVNGTAALLGGTSGRLRRTQTGFVRSYALTILGGTVVLVAALLTVGSG
jgi:NADH-quinone oxidoreductase subunit L